MRRDRRLTARERRASTSSRACSRRSSASVQTRRAGIDRVGGAYDYSRGRLLIVPRLIQTRQQLDYTIAHELTHALEAQRFRLGLARLDDPSERERTRRAVIEGTATFVQDLYRQRYLHDEVPIAQRLEGMRSVIAAAPGAYAVNAQAVFDYADGARFIRSLYRRAGGWRLVDRALEKPPTRSTQVLHPRTWPARITVSPIRLHVAPLLRPGGGRWEAAPRTRSRRS